MSASRPPEVLTPGVVLVLGILLMVAAVESRLGLGLAGLLLIAHGYRAWVADSDGPLDDGETLLREVGEGGEPDRPVRLSDLEQSGEEAAEKD